MAVPGLCILYVFSHAFLSVTPRGRLPFPHWSAGIETAAQGQQDPDPGPLLTTLLISKSGNEKNIREYNPQMNPNLE